MADNISNIVDPSVFPDLDKLIGRLVDVEGEISAINGKTVTIQVDLKGAENLNQLTAAVQQQQVTIEKLSAVQIENAQATQQMNNAELQLNTTTTGNIRLLLEQKQELQYVNAEIKRLSNETITNETAHKRNNDQLVKATARQIELKQAISANNAALKDSAVQVNNVSNSFNILGVSGEGIEKLFGRMILRMAAMQLIIAPVIAGVGALWESFNKLSDAQERATKTLKDYEDSAKELQDFQSNIYSGEQASKANYEILINTIREKTSGILAQKEAYKDLQAIMPGITNAYTMADIANGKDAIGMRQKANYIIELTESIKQNKTTYEQVLKDYKKLEEQYLLGDTEPNNKTTAHVNEQKALTQAYLVAKNDLVTRRAQLIDESVKLRQANPDADKTKPKIERKSYGEEISAENEKYKLELATNKSIFDASRQTFTEREQLREADEQSAQVHFEKLRQLTEKYAKDTNQSKTWLAAKELQFAADQRAVDNANTEEAKKDALLIQKRHEEAAKAIDEQISKMEDERAKIRELAQELDDIQSGAKKHHDYAKGGNPFLEALGFSPDFADEQDDFEKKIARAKDKLADLADKRGNAYATGDTTKIGAANLAFKGGEKDLAQLEADKQQAIDDKIIAGKKEVAERTVELAKQTFEALKTISDNQIAAEQQQIDIKQRQIRLQYEQQIEAINASAGYQITKDNQKAKAAAQLASEENSLQQKSNQLLLKKARNDKTAAEASIVANTAEAIMKTYASYSALGPEGTALAAGIAALIAATGAVQFAAAASTPLPQFADGTEGTTTSHFIAGEQGAELGITPSGKTMMFNKEGIYSAPIGTKIKTADETAAILKYASSTIGMSAYDLIGLQVNGNDKAIEKVGKIVNDKFEDVKDDLVSAIYGINRGGNVTVIAEGSKLQFRKK